MAQGRDLHTQRSRIAGEPAALQPARGSDLRPAQAPGVHRVERVKQTELISPEHNPLLSFCWLASGTARDFSWTPEGQGAQQRCPRPQGSAHTAASATQTPAARNRDINNARRTGEQGKRCCQVQFWGKRAAGVGKRGFCKPTLSFRNQNQVLPQRKAQVAA